MSLLSHGACTIACTRLKAIYVFENKSKQHRGSAAGGANHQNAAKRVWKQQSRSGKNVPDTTSVNNVQREDPNKVLGRRDAKILKDAEDALDVSLEAAMQTNKQLHYSRNSVDGWSAFEIKDFKNPRVTLAEMNQRYGVVTLVDVVMPAIQAAEIAASDKLLKNDNAEAFGPMTEEEYSVWYDLKVLPDLLRNDVGPYKGPSSIPKAVRQGSGMIYGIIPPAPRFKTKFVWDVIAGLNGSSLQGKFLPEWEWPEYESKSAKIQKKMQHPRNRMPVISSADADPKSMRRRQILFLDSQPYTRAFVPLRSFPWDVNNFKTTWWEAFTKSSKVPLAYGAVYGGLAMAYKFGIDKYIAGPHEKQLVRRWISQVGDYQALYDRMKVWGASHGGVTLRVERPDMGDRHYDLPSFFTEMKRVLHLQKGLFDAPSQYLESNTPLEVIGKSFSLAHEIMAPEVNDHPFKMIMKDQLRVACAKIASKLVDTHMITPKEYTEQMVSLKNAEELSLPSWWRQGWHSGLHRLSESYGYWWKGAITAAAVSTLLMVLYNRSNWRWDYVFVKNISSTRVDMRPDSMSHTDIAYEDPNIQVWERRENLYVGGVCVYTASVSEHIISYELLGHLLGLNVMGASESALTVFEKMRNHCMTFHRMGMDRNSAFGLNQDNICEQTIAMALGQWLHAAEKNKRLTLSFPKPPAI